jgi:hypothetical protein
MEKFAFILKRTFLFMAICFLCEGIMAQEKTNDVQNVLKKVQETGNVHKIEIIHYPVYILTRISVSPEWLEEDYHYKLTLRDEGIRLYLPGLAQALQDTRIVKGNPEDGRDVRWGILLFDSENRRIASIYMERFGDRGYVDAIPVNFSANETDKGLSWWLKNNFSDVFKLDGL